MASPLLAIEADAKLGRTAQGGDMVFISLEFELMQSFLNVTNKVGEQLRDDCIISNSKEQEHPYGVRHAWRCPPLEVDHAVAEIDQQLKVRVVDVSNCYTRYCPSNLSCCSSAAARACRRWRNGVLMLMRQEMP